MDCEYCHSYPHLQGCPNEPEPKIHGYCPLCYGALRDDYPYWTDKYGNIFDSKECACLFNKIQEKEWDINNE